MDAEIKIKSVSWFIRLMKTLNLRLKIFLMSKKSDPTLKKSFKKKAILLKLPLKLQPPPAKPK